MCWQHIIKVICIAQIPSTVLCLLPPLTDTRFNLGVIVPTDSCHELTCDYRHCGCFARSVVSKKRCDVALVDVQVHIVYCHHLSPVKCFTQTLNSQAHLHPSRRCFKVLCCSVCLSCRRVVTFLLAPLQQPIKVRRPANQILLCL